MAWKESRASRRARVARQLRDRHGKWIEMGGGVKWFGKGGTMKSGVVVGFQGKDAVIKFPSGMQSLIPARTLEPIKAKAKLPFRGVKKKSAITGKKDKDAFNRDVVRIKDNTDDRITTNASELEVGDRVWAVNSPMGNGFDNGSNNAFSVPETRADVLENSGFEVQLDKDGSPSYGTVVSVNEGKFVVVDDGSSTGKVIPWDHHVLADDSEIADAIEGNSSAAKDREEKASIPTEQSEAAKAPAAPASEERATTPEPTPAPVAEKAPEAPAAPTPAPVDRTKDIQAQIRKERTDFQARPVAEKNLLEAGFNQNDIDAFNNAKDIDDLSPFADLNDTYKDRVRAVENLPAGTPWKTGQIEKNEKAFVQGPLKDKVNDLLGSENAGKEYTSALGAGLSHERARDFAKATTPEEVDKAINVSNNDESAWAKDFYNATDYAKESQKERLGRAANEKKERLRAESESNTASESATQTETETESETTTESESNTESEESAASESEAEAGAEESTESESDAATAENVDLTGLGLSKEDSDYVNEAKDAKEALDRLDESEAGLLNDSAKETGDKDYQKQFRAARNDLMSKYAPKTDAASTDSPEAPKTGQGTSTKSVAKSIDNLGADLQDITDNQLEGDEYENALDEAVYDFKSDNGRDFFMSGSQNDEGDWEVDLFDSDNKHVGTFSPSDYKNSEEFADAIKKRADDEGEGDSSSEDSTDEVYNDAENDTVEDTTPTEESEPANGREPEREAGTESDTGTGEGSGGPEASDDVDSGPDNSAAPEEVVEERPAPTSEELAEAEELADQEATDSLAESPARKEVLDEIASAADRVKDLAFEDVERAVAGYTYRGDGQINWPLRGDKQKKLGTQYLEEDYNVAEAIAQIDRAMELSKFDSPKTLSRGLKVQNHDDFKVGDVVSDKAFVSSTDDAEVALGFGRGGAVMKIEAPEGLHAVDVVDILNRVEPTSMMLHENEFLLPRGTRIEITGIEDLTSGNFEDHFPDVSEKWDREPWRRDSSKKILDNNGTTKLFHARIVSDDLGFNGEHDNVSYESTKAPPVHDPHERAWFDEYGTYEAPTTVEEMNTVISAERGNPKDASRSEKWEVTDIGDFAREYQQMRKLPFMSDAVWLPFKDSRATDKEGFSVQNLGNSKFVVRNPDGAKIGTVDTYADFMDTKPSDLRDRVNEVKDKWKNDQEVRKQFSDPQPVEAEPESDAPAPSGEDLAKQIIDLDRGVPDDAPQYADTPADAFDPSKVDISDLIDMYKEKDEGLEDLPQAESNFKQDADKIQKDIDNYEVDDPKEAYKALRDKINKMVDSMFEQDPDAPNNADFDKRYDDANYELHLLTSKYGPNGEGKEDEKSSDEPEFTNDESNDTVDSNVPTDGENNGEATEDESRGGADSERESGTSGGRDGVVEPLGDDRGGESENGSDDQYGAGSELRELGVDDVEDIASNIASFTDPQVNDGFDLPNGGRIVFKKTKMYGKPRWVAYDRDNEKVFAVDPTGKSPEAVANALASRANAYDRVKGALHSNDRSLKDVTNADFAIASVGTFFETPDGKKTFRKVGPGVWEQVNNDTGQSEAYSGMGPMAFSEDLDELKVFHDDEFQLHEDDIRSLDDDDLDSRLNEISTEAAEHYKVSGDLGDKQHLGSRLSKYEETQLHYSGEKAKRLAEAGRPLAREKFRRLTENQNNENYDLSELGDFDGIAATDRTPEALDQTQWDKIRNTYVVKDATTLKNNADLRSDKPSRGAKAWGTRVTKMVNSQELVEDTTFHRGIAASPEIAAQFVPGAVFSDKGTMSVDVSKDSAEIYLNARHSLRPESIPVALDLKVRKGQKIADVAYGEFVLAPDSRIFVESVRDDENGKRHVVGIVNPTDEEISAWTNGDAQSDSSEDSGAGVGTSSDVSSEQTESDSGAGIAPAGDSGAATGISTESDSGAAPRRIDDSDFDEIERQAQELQDSVYDNEDPMSQLGRGIDLPDGSELMFDTINSDGDEGFLLLDPKGEVIGRYRPGGKGQGRKAAKRAQSMWDKANGGAPTVERAAPQQSVDAMDGAPFAAGDRVTHGKHGAGTVVKIEGNGEYARIRFDDRPQTKLYGIKMTRLTPEGSGSETPSAPQTPATAPSNTPNVPSGSDSPFQVGQRVWHGKHGAGQVTRLEGNGEYARIEFDHTPGKHFGIKMSKLQSEEDRIKDPSTKITTPDNSVKPTDPAPSKTKVPVDEDGTPFIPGANDAKLYVGAIVVHPKFGRGRIIKLEGNGQYVRVVFDNDPLGKPRGITGGKLEDAAIVDKRDFGK